ncbi:MAG: hypothetical protein QNK04_24230, partial [Myxococcota bacterium]|nr:hypothetical protein [Myxococcota bacterium]
MANDVRIAELETQAGGQQVHFELLGGCKGARSVSFRCSESLLEPSPEALLPCRLLPAMRRGCDLDLPDPLSPRLMAAVPTIVDILAAWFPKLQRVSVRGQSRAAMPRRASGRVGSFFSGGLDSFYTLLKHRDEITDLIFVHGFDVSPRATGVLRYIASDLEELGGDLGVNVLHVETNLRDAVLDCTDWGFGHGPALMAVGHMLAPSFERIYVPASCSYTGLFPWGSHPLLDPLWSSELLEFVHDGCEANRVEKADLIGGSEAALRHLRVCPKSPEGA